MEPREINIDQWIEVTHKYPNHIHFIGSLIHRPGLVSLAFVIEHYDFSPRTELNDQYLLNIVEWEEDMWVAVSVPRDKREIVEKRVEQMTFRIASAPPMFLKCGHVKFAFSNKGARTKEDVKRLMSEMGVPPQLMAFGEPEHLTFPGPFADMFALEYKTKGLLANSQKKFNDKENVSKIRKRELSLQPLYELGLQPNPLLVVKYFLGEIPHERLTKSGKRRHADEMV